MDPEVFLKDKSGKHLSVVGMIGANKWAPMQIPDMDKGFTLQEDNVALEFGTPPASSADEFVFNTRAVMLAGLSKLKDKRFSRLSCTIFDEDQMQSPEAHVFGCEPDFNAWTKMENDKPTPPHPYTLNCQKVLLKRIKLMQFVLVIYFLVCLPFCLTLARNDANFMERLAHSVLNLTGWSIALYLISGFSRST
jgi:hypothetical protein